MKTPCSLTKDCKLSALGSCALRFDILKIRKSVKKKWDLSGYLARNITQVLYTIIPDVGWLLCKPGPLFFFFGL